MDPETTEPSLDMAEPEQHHIVLIGTGTIGLSFAAFHLLNPGPFQIPKLTIIDPRPDLTNHINQHLTGYLPTTHHHLLTSHINTSPTPTPAILSTASIIQESGPENLAFKRSLWSQLEPHIQPTTLLWSSTSGIPASLQSSTMVNPSRLLIVHPFNPPHLMPLIELIPSPSTSPTVLAATTSFFQHRGRDPVVVRKEIKGFVANRLAFALLREAVALVKQGIVSPDEVDRVVEGSMGPRWAVRGPFASYRAGGGVQGEEGEAGGFRAFWDKIGGTVEDVWGDMDIVREREREEEEKKEENERRGEATGKEDWLAQLCAIVDGPRPEARTMAEELERRDRLTKKILDVIAEEDGAKKKKT